MSLIGSGDGRRCAGRRRLSSLGGEAFGADDAEKIATASNGLVDNGQGDTVGFSIANGKISIVIVGNQ